MQRIVLSLITASAVLMGCPTPSNQCTSSTQCGAGQSCVNGTCMGGSSGGTSGTGGGTSATGGGTSGTGGGSSGTGGGAMAGGASGGGSSAGESCSMAGAAQAGMTITGDTTGASDDVNVACTGGRNPGPDHVYTITVPPTNRLTVTATPEVATDGGDQYDVALYLVEAPAANCTPADAGTRAGCLGGADDSRDPAAVESLSYTNTTASPKEVFVVVDSFFPVPDSANGVTNVGPYSLRIDLATPSVGDLCSSATAITPGTLTGQSLTGFLPDYGTSTNPNCVTGDGADRVYSISVPAGRRLTATATPDNDAGFDVFVNLVAGPATACEASPLVCLDGADPNGNGQAETVSHFNGGAAAEDVFVVVGNFDARDTDTNFSLTTAIVTPPAGDDCSMPTMLTAGTALTGQDFTGFVSDFSFGSGCASPSAGPDRVYSVTVPQDKVLTVTVTPDAMVDTSISLVDGNANCAPLACLAGSPSAAAGTPDVAVWSNRTGAAKTLLVIVDSSTTANLGTFSINAVLSDPPMGDSCATATTLQANTTVAGTTAGYNNDYTSSMAPTCAGFNTLGNDRVYAVTVPNGQRGKVTLIADAGFAPSLSLVSGTAASCEASPRVCVGSADSLSNTTADGGFTPQPRTAGFFNGSGAPATAFAIVDGLAGPGGQFTIAFTSAAPPTDDTCTTASTALAATTLTNQSLRPSGVTFEKDYPCIGGTGPDRVYVAQAANNQRLQVTVTPTPMTMDAGFDPTISIIDGPATACDSTGRRCLAGVDAVGRQQPETAGFSNVSGAAKTVYVVVGSRTDAPSTEPLFSLAATSAALQPGDLCETAQAVTSGMSLPTESVMGYFHDYAFSTAGGCRSGPGADRVYSINVPAGQTLTARAVPDAAADVVVNIVDGPATNCTATPRITCLASADRGLDGQEDIATWMNGTGAAKTVLVVISNYTTGPMTYSLELTVQ